jgi:hypothetical protein
MNEAAPPGISPDKNLAISRNVWRSAGERVRSSGEGGGELRVFLLEFIMIAKNLSVDLLLEFK